MSGPWCAGAFALAILLSGVFQHGVRAQPDSSGFSREQPRSADDFVDSIGVNVHLHYNNTPYYAQFPAFAKLLEATGIRHLRDGLIDTTYQGYYDHLNELGRAGIRADLVTNVGQTDALLRAYPSRVADAFESYEEPNEFDGHQSEPWAAELRAFAAILYASAKSAKGGDGYPVIGPSVRAVNSYQFIGDLSPWIDYGNMHNYFGGFNPGTDGWGSAGFGSRYGSIRYNLGAEAQVSQSKPVMTTETGYCTVPNARNSVPVVIQGRYIPRMFFEQFNAHVARTYEYEFADEGGGDFGACGLVTSELRPKPAYHALTALLHALVDRGAAFTTTALSFALSGQTADVHHTLLQKRNGTYELAVWIERPSWDPNAQRMLTVTSQTITLRLRVRPRSASLYRIDDSGNMTKAKPTFQGGTADIVVTDAVSLIAFHL